jgi:HSP20 family protein
MAFTPFGKELPMSLGDLQSEMNRMFDRVWHGGLSTGPFDGNAWSPIFDVLDEDDRVVVSAEMPGVDAAAIELCFHDNRLTLKGHRESPWPEEVTKKLIRRERRYGAFSRTLDVAAEIDADKIAATVRNGVMTVTLPKVAQARGKAIKVDVAE